VSADLAGAVESLYASLVRRARRDAPELEPALTPTQRLALTLAADLGPLRLGVLAQRLGTSDSAATRAVDALAAAGFVERIPDPEDGRAVLVGATPAGRARVAEIRERLERALQPAADALEPADRERLVELLGRLSGGLDDDGSRARGVSRASGS
jgi:DNA-binding MarR family transcriptional regulator